MKWNESGFRPPLCTYRLNWARRTSWGWWDDWDDTVLQTQDSKFEPWRSEAEHATSRSRRLPTILTFTRGWGRNNFVSFKPPRPGTEPRTLAWKAAVLTTTLGPPPVLVNTLLLLATCPVSLNCSLTHEQRGTLTQCCFNDGPHFQRSGDVETVLFQCITLITFGILYQTSPNLQGSRRNGCELCVQKYMWSDWELTEISIKNDTAGLVQCLLSVLH